MSLILSLLAIAGVVYLWRLWRKQVPLSSGDLATRVAQLEAAERRRTQREIEARR